MQSEAQELNESKSNTSGSDSLERQEQSSGNSQNRDEQNQDEQPQNNLDDDQNSEDVQQEQSEDTENEEEVMNSRSNGSPGVGTKAGETLGTIEHNADQIISIQLGNGLDKKGMKGQEGHQILSFTTNVTSNESKTQNTSASMLHEQMNNKSPSKVEQQKKLVGLSTELRRSLLKPTHHNLSNQIQGIVQASEPTTPDRGDRFRADPERKRFTTPSAFLRQSNMPMQLSASSKKFATPFGSNLGVMAQQNEAYMKANEQMQAETAKSEQKIIVRRKREEQVLIFEAQQAQKLLKDELDLSERASVQSKRTSKKKRKEDKEKEKVAEDAKPKGPKRKLIFNTYNTAYPVIDLVAKNLGFRTMYKDHNLVPTTETKMAHRIAPGLFSSIPIEEFDVVWFDLTISGDVLRQIKPHQRISQWPGIQVITHKNKLAKNLMMMQNLAPQEYDFFPSTYLLPSDLNEFKKVFRARDPPTYIVKPNHDCQGRGIYLMNSFEDLQDQEASTVAQVYIDDPFLIDGLKFDLRLYVLLFGINPLRIYLFDDGLARFATNQYKSAKESDLKDLFTHLTNYSINKMSKNYKQNDLDEEKNKGGQKPFSHKRSLKDIYKIIEDQGRDSAKVKRDVKDLIIKTIITGQNSMHHIFRSAQPDDMENQMCFQVLGFDVMFDSKLKPWLIEINQSPSFATDSAFDFAIKKKLMHDTFTLLNLSSDRKNDYLAQKEKLYFERMMTGHKTLKPTYEEKELKRYNLDVERDKFDKQVLDDSGYECIFPVKSNEDLMRKYKDFLRMAKDAQDAFTHGSRKVRGLLEENVYDHILKAQEKAKPPEKKERPKTAGQRKGSTAVTTAKKLKQKAENLKEESEVEKTQLFFQAVSDTPDIKKTPVKEAAKKAPKVTYENNYIEMNKKVTVIKKEPKDLAAEQEKIMKALYSDFSSNRLQNIIKARPRATSSVPFQRMIERAPEKEASDRLIPKRAAMRPQHAKQQSTDIDLAKVNVEVVKATPKSRKTAKVNNYVEETPKENLVAEPVRTNPINTMIKNSYLRTQEKESPQKMMDRTKSPLPNKLSKRANIPSPKPDRDQDYSPLDDMQERSQSPSFENKNNKGLTTQERLARHKQKLLERLKNNGEKSDTEKAPSKSEKSENVQDEKPPNRKKYQYEAYKRRFFQNEKQEEKAASTKESPKKVKPQNIKTSHAGVVDIEIIQSPRESEKKDVVKSKPAQKPSTNAPNFNNLNKRKTNFQVVPDSESSSSQAPSEKSKSSSKSSSRKSSSKKSSTPSERSSSKKSSDRSEDQGDDESEEEEKQRQHLKSVNSSIPVSTPSRVLKTPLKRKASHSQEKEKKLKSAKKLAKSATKKIIPDRGEDSIIQKSIKKSIEMQLITKQLTHISVSAELDHNKSQKKDKAKQSKPLPPEKDFMAQNLQKIQQIQKQAIQKQEQEKAEKEAIMVNIESGATKSPSKKPDKKKKEVNFQKSAGLAFQKIIENRKKQGKDPIFAIDKEFDNNVIIGKGNFAVIKKCTHKKTNYNVAIKTYEKKLLTRKSQLMGIHREIYILAGLDHPNIMKLFEVIDSQDSVNLVVEYCQGPNLLEYIKKTGQKGRLGKQNSYTSYLSEQRAKSIFKQLVVATNYMHGLGLVHRDLRIENILINDQTSDVKFIDFGFATSFQASDSLKAVGGTPNYKNPETIKSKTIAGQVADTYALAIILYILLTGGVPDWAQIESDTYQKVLAHKLMLPVGENTFTGQKLELYSNDCQALIAKMFQNDIKNRITTEDILKHSWFKRDQASKQNSSKKDKDDK